MKRIAMLMSVVALMVVMMAMSVAPAFALQRMDGPCRTGDIPYYYVGNGDQTLLRVDRNGDGFVCATLSKPTDPLSDYRYYENRGYLVLP